MLLLLFSIPTQAFDFSGVTSCPFGRAEADDVEITDYPSTVEQHLDGSTATLEDGSYLRLRFKIYISGGGNWSNEQFIISSNERLDYSYTYPSKVTFTTYEASMYWSEGGSGLAEYSITW